MLNTWSFVGALAVSLLASGCATSKPQPKPSEAAERVSYYRARAKGPGTYPAYARLGLAELTLYKETGDARLYNDALTNLQQSLTFQRNFDALLGMALVLSERHHFAEALPYAHEALQTSPGHAEAEAALVDIQLALGDVPAARATIEGMLSRGQPGFPALTRAAALHEAEGDLPGAIDFMQRAGAEADRAQQSAQTRAWCQTRVGSMRMGLCDPAAARVCYDRALLISPGYYFANEHLAEWHAARKEWKDAEKIYRALMKTRPEPQYRIALAEALENRGRNSEARLEVEGAIRELRQSVASGAIDQLRELAVVLLCEEKPAGEALAVAERDYQMRKDFYGVDTLAWALSAARRHEDALKLSESIMAQAAKHPGVLLHAALIRLRAGKMVEGRALLAKATECPAAFTTAERKAWAQAERLAR